MGGRGSGSGMAGNSRGGGGTIASIVGASSPSLISPERFNSQLAGSEYVRPSNYGTVVQNVSNNGGTIYELNGNLGVKRITPSDRSPRLLLNGDWAGRSEVIEYMTDQNKKGHLFFAKFD